MNQISNRYIALIERPTVLDCGVLIDRLERDRTAAMATSRQSVKQLLALVTEAHAYWIRGQGLTGKARRNAGTPFVHTRNLLEDWLRENDARKCSVRSQNGYIYFVGIEGTPDAVKIGFATNVRARIADLQIASPKKLITLLVITGNRRKERDLHKKKI